MRTCPVVFLPAGCDNLVDKLSFADLQLKLYEEQELAPPPTGAAMGTKTHLDSLSLSAVLQSLSSQELQLV